MFLLLAVSAQTGAQNFVDKTVIDLSASNAIYETNIRKIIEDKYGYKWIASQESAVRYDGRLIQRLSHSNEQKKYQLSGVDVWDIEEDKEADEIYILTSFGDIDIINASTASVKYRISRPSGPENNWFMNMILTPETIWVNSFSGLYMYQKRSKKYFQVLDYSKNGAGEAISKRIFKDNQNNIWAFDKSANILIYNAPDGKAVNASIKKGKLPQGVIINDVVQVSNSKLLIATSYGIFEVVYSANYEIYVSPFFSNTKPPLQESVESLILTKNRLYFSAKTIYEYNLETGILSGFNDRNAFSSKNLFQSIQAMYYDKNEMLWLGGRDGLGYFNAGSPGITSFYKDLGNKNALEHVFFVYPESDSVYYASTMNGLYRVYSNKKIEPIEQTGWFNYQFKVDLNKSIVSERSRLYVFNGKQLSKIEEIYPEFKPYRNYSLNSHVKFGDSLIVMGTENFMGILLWNTKQKTIKNILSSPNIPSPFNLAANLVNTLFRGSNNEVIILSDKSISKLNLSNYQIENYQILDTKNETPLGTLFDITAVNDEYLVAIYGTGLVRTDRNFNIKKIYSTADGLSNNGIYKLFKTDENTIFITTNNGLNVFKLKEGKFFHLSSLNGLHSNTFEEACGVIYENKKIIAGGVKGFSVIDPAKVHINDTAPILFINTITSKYTDAITDTINVNIHTLKVGSNILQLSVFVSAINWVNPGQTSFAYRILEKGNEWINMSTQNLITLISQPPGTYHLQVKAANEDGVWSESKELILVFLPKWYQTWWFKLLVFLTTASIIYAFYRYRIRQIEKQHAIRKNIATDLHDDLGSTLNSVKVFTNLAISGVKQEESLQQVKDNLTEATMSLRDMIWVLDDSLDTVDELITRLKQFAIPVAGASNMEAIIKANSEVNSRQLTKEEKRNLFLICKEAINNSIKYSGASRIDVDITASGKKIQIVVADNGKGFNVDEVKKGYGLKNMQYRAGQIKYKVEFVSSPGKGTQITILHS